MKRFEGIICGLHSNIPLCCIAYFNLYWLFLNEDKRKTRFEHHLNAYDYRFKKMVNYIPCPLCVRRRHFVIIRNCPWSTRKQYRCCQNSELRFLEPVVKWWRNRRRRGNEHDR